MILENLYSILKATGYPVAYSHFEEKTPLPFITYVVDSSNNFFADDKVYKKIESIRIELYTAKKDLEAERKIEELLNENEIPYECSETWINSEKVSQKIYEVELI